VYDVLLHDERTMSPAAVAALNKAVGWWPDRSEAGIASTLGPLTVGSWHGSELVGFARAVSDGVLRAYIEDVMVHPQHQHHGLGRAMLDRLLAELDEVDVVSLFCAERLVPLYVDAGFQMTRQRVLHRSRR
jgi:ribosomal protein S18 acetylase RimI-like enzyme